VTAGIVCGNLPSLSALIRKKGKEQIGGMIAPDANRFKKPPTNLDNMPDLVFLGGARGEVV